ncbi:MAG: shikimate dehydrogenase [Gemmatimonadota bacterium]
MIGASTRLVALLGNPVSHSLSPRIQNAAFRALSVDGVYVALRCEESDVPGLVRGIARAGGAGNFTLPHKEIAARTVDHPSELVRRTGACNTFWLENGLVHGENTDVAGFRGAVEALIGRSAKGLRVLLLGAGGSARGALEGLLADGVGEAWVWNRTPDRARALVAVANDPRVSALDSLGAMAGEPLDLIVNATSLGLRDSDSLPIDLSEVAEPGALLDLVYRPAETPLVRFARTLGIPAADGGEMLVRQGAEAFRLWWGHPAPLQVMQEAMAGSRTAGAGAAGG